MAATVRLCPVGRGPRPANQCPSTSPRLYPSTSPQERLPRRSQTRLPRRAHLCLSAAPPLPYESTLRPRLQAAATRPLRWRRRMEDAAKRLR
uniref:Uncharacterized protein n=1 Tax=Zea mays TaxID=4577 RepID=A0A804UAJ8_MAIZE